MAKKLPKVKGGKGGKGKQFLKAFGANLLGSYGFQSDHFSKTGFVHGKLGLYSEAVKKTTVDKGPETPALVKPKNMPNVANPTLASISKQLSSLVKISKALGLVSKKQQEALIKQIAQADRVAKENALESNANAEMLGGKGIGGDIGPVNDALMDLAQELAKLTKVVQEKVDDQGGGILGSMASTAASLLPGRKTAKAASRVATKVSQKGLNKGFSSFVDKAGKTRYRNAMGRYVSAAEAVKAPLLQRASKAVGSTVVSSRVGGLMSTAFRKAATKSGAVKVASAELIKKVAGPIVSKGLGKTVLKSIPVVGTVAGLGFAAKRLIEGDPVGAGLDAVSGLGSAMTAIPAFVASVARDVYTNVFGIHPEEDPNAASRLAMVTNAVKSLVEETLRPRLQPKQKPSQAAMTFKAPPAPSVPSSSKTAGSTMTSPQTVAAPPKNDVSAPSSPSGGGGSGGSSAPAAKPAPSGGGSQPAAGASVAPKPETQNPYPNASADAEKIAPSPSTGASIVSATQENAAIETESMVPKIVTVGTQVPMPSFNTTTRNGARGIGNVPDPNYGGVPMSLPDQLYFTAAV